MGGNMGYLVVSMSVLLVVLQQQHVFVGAVLPPTFVEKWHVHVANELSNGKLMAHCKSRDTDLGEQYIERGAQIQWSFKENVWGTTLFWCYMKNPSGAFASLEVFWHEINHYWLHYRCTLDGICFWTAKDDGIYLKNIPDGIDERIHEWKWKME